MKVRVAQALTAADREGLLVPCMSRHGAIRHLRLPDASKALCGVEAVHSDPFDLKPCKRCQAILSTAKGVAKVHSR